MVCESTNVERPGHSSSESKVGETFADLFGKAPGRIMVATFSSNIYRMQQIFNAAEKYNRKVALIGRSMLNVFNAASALGYMTMRPDTLIDINQLDRYDADEIVIITTGSQGEPMSALTRMAFSEHKRVEILPDDTVIISASPIPGNEKPIYRVINELFKRGAHVVYESLAEIHVSGHAYREELKLIHESDQTALFHPRPRRIPASLSACRARQPDGCAVGEYFSAQQRRYFRISGEPRQDQRLYYCWRHSD